MCIFTSVTNYNSWEFFLDGIELSNSNHSTSNDYYQCFRRCYTILFIWLIRPSRAKCEHLILI